MTKKPDFERDTAQHRRFLEAARAFGCNDDETAFDEKLKVIAGQRLPGAKDQVTKPGDKGDKGRATKKAAD